MEEYPTFGKVHFPAVADEALATSLASAAVAFVSVGASKSMLSGPVSVAAALGAAASSCRPVAVPSV